MDRSRKGVQDHGRAGCYARGMNPASPTTPSPLPENRSDKRRHGDLTLRFGYEPGAIGRIGELHGRYYAEVWKSGAPFEILMLRELCEFVEHYDDRRDLLVTAHRAGELIGSLAVIGGAVRPEQAQWRFVIVAPQHQGIGAGRAMVQHALNWCRERGFIHLFLWTVEGLPASRTLYESVGFRVVERVRDARYSVPHENLKMELRLA